MKKIISILTATRAEYGLLKPIIKKLIEIQYFDIRIVVTGMHLSKEYGLTYQEIEQDGFLIDRKIEILQDTDSSAAISKSMGLAMIGFGEYFEELHPDLLIVLGDRYETLAVCCAAMNARIPIAHLYGGETTEGAVDEAIRHAITKMSYLHFTSTEEYRKRVIQLGEAPDRVYQVGAIGIENIYNTKLLSKKELEQSIQFILDKPYAVITFHPVTLEENYVKEQFEELLEALDNHNEMRYIFTKANADTNGRVINALIDEYTKKNLNTVAFTSLGMLRYLSSLKYCDMVIGNSSSGILEAPSFGIPTINIGDRQKGRLQSESIINCTADAVSISIAINHAKSIGFRKRVSMAVNPYGDGKTSDKIVKVIKDFLINDEINLKKQFYNLDFQINLLGNK
jgi:GDP/UDP-N,N'-diacetylbacillosamine 2-epimerase (hydrolysing)